MPLRLFLPVLWRGSVIKSAIVGFLALAAILWLWKSERQVIGAGLPPPPPASLGINLANPNYWGGDRAFMNLAVGGTWLSASASGWAEFDKNRLDQNGTIKVLLPGEAGNAILVPPEAAYQGEPVRIRCEWAGTGKVDVGGVQNASSGANRSEFVWPPLHEGKPAQVWISVTRTAPTDPVRGIDCREAEAARTAIFSPAFLDFLSGFKVLRFLDWQNTNLNANLTWAGRTTPDTQFQTNERGVAVEYMVALSNETGADPWFTMPWNADEDYVRRFAEYVRDHLKPDRTVYAELSNEVWNWMFPVTTQASEEGVARNLASDRHQAALLRYAEKSVWMLKIWADVFRETPNRLVRVVATQNAVPWGAEQILTFRDTAMHVDALATAPYFGHGLFEGGRTPATGRDTLFAYLDADITESMDKAVENRTIAARFGKRFLAYEAGQHIVNADDVNVVAEFNRSPRMYDAYQRYLRQWRDRAGDLMMIYASTGPIANFGAWGIREYTGQPLEETPKRRAVLDFIREIGR